MARTGMGGHGSFSLFRVCIIVAGAALIVGAFEGTARAQGDTDNCYVEFNVRWCGAPNGTTTHGIFAVVGSDPWGQWVGWRDYTTGECLGWDWVGDTNGFFHSTVVSGTSFTDYLSVVSFEDYEFCGFPLDPPANNAIITLEGWFGGADALEAYSGLHVDMNCYLSDNCFAYLGTEGTIYGSEWGQDVVVKSGAGSWNFWTYGGDDEVMNFSSVAPTNADCGDGADVFSGERQGAPLWGCETVN